MAFAANVVRVDRGAVPVPGIVEYAGRTWPSRLVYAAPPEGLVESSLVTSFGSLLLVQLRPDVEGAAPLYLEAAVLRVAAPRSPVDGFSSYLVRWRWAWSRDGEEALRERLWSDLGMELLDPDALRPCGEGVLYALERGAERSAGAVVRRLRLGDPDRVLPESSEPSAAPVLPARDPCTRIRGLERIRVDRPCRYVLRGQESTGWLRDLSLEGAFVGTRGALPKAGERVGVLFAPTIGGRSVPIALTGFVRWWHAAPTDTQARGFGLHVDSVLDGKGGELFHRYLDRLLAARE